MKATMGYLVLNADGSSRIHLATNTPPAKAAKARACECATCRPRSKPPASTRTPEPFDLEATILHARRLDDEAVEAAANGDADRAAELRDRALLVHDLAELHGREEGRKAGIMTEVRARRFVRPIVAAPWERSALDD